MADVDLLAVFTEQISELKAAVRAIILLDRAIEDGDPEVAEAATIAFQTHAPGFKFDEQKGTPDGRFKVDTAIRGVFTETVQAAVRAGERVLQHRLPGAARPSVPQLLDLARYLATVQLSENILFLNLISDLVEVSGIEEGADIFAHLEACVPHLTAKHNFEAQGATAKLALLRACNQLLRRLSRAHHVGLAGRIHLLLSRLLPALDRSAVNSMGFHNDTHAIELEDVPEGFLGTDGQPVDAAFYRQFWSLQQVFQQPNAAADPNLWLQVHAGIKAVLARFAAVKLGAGGGGGEGLTVKYLSSPRLLHLQLRDPGTRRHFLVQCLALLQACGRRASAKQETFRIKQQGEADDLKALLFKELERTPPHGPAFAAAAAALLAAEDAWADWKAEGAKSFERPEAPLLPPPPPPAKRRRLSRPGAANLGSRELTRLWNQTPDNLGACHRDARKHLPSLREFLNPVIEEMDPEEGIEEQYKRKLDPVYRWEVLRAIARHSPVDLAAVVRSRDKAPDLEDAARHIFPQDVPEESALPPPSPGPLALSAAAEAPMEIDSQLGARPAEQASAGERGPVDGASKAAESAGPAEAAPGANGADEGAGGAAHVTQPQANGTKEVSDAEASAAAAGGSTAAAQENGRSAAEENGSTDAEAAAAEPAAEPAAPPAAGSKAKPAAAEPAAQDGEAEASGQAEAAS